jgi:hypothetical protein
MACRSITTADGSAGSAMVLQNASTFRPLTICDGSAPARIMRALRALDPSARTA